MGESPIELNNIPPNGLDKPAMQSTDNVKISCPNSDTVGNKSALMVFDNKINVVKRKYSQTIPDNTSNNRLFSNMEN